VSDIHRGLVFIGLESGGAVNPTVLRFWAHGDRVMAGIRRPDGDVLLSVEEAIFDQQTGTALPEEGFVFTGSMQVTTMDKPDEKQYAADVYDPRAVTPVK
jgi:hypothetical protein